MKKAIFAGSFDPLHQGHLKIIEKGLQMFEKIFVVIANNDFKANQESLGKRARHVKTKLNHKNVEVKILDQKYLAKWACQNNVKYLIRSARNNTDFKYELDMAKMNKIINHQLETILIIPNYEDIDFSSRKFKEFNRTYQKEGGR